MNVPACGHSVKITIKNSGHRRKFAIQCTKEEMQRRRMNACGRGSTIRLQPVVRLDRSLAPSSGKPRLPGRRFYPVNTFSL
ncbi:hypothetical protein SJ05684_c09900 [Sinorhizobium sojae CCBAU 05684]|uniref:Uncharacterized protein n=1 Tax=Sinorhizobium sojae CCBAU 05684 TaxID=716928 RepID=A0A249PAY8_9HYPH|nr:hypothetical protein SJ05684_c09900 [Sinorhizobium sojae CCBAU 05684]